MKNEIEELMMLTPKRKSMHEGKTATHVEAQ